MPKATSYTAPKKGTEQAYETFPYSFVDLGLLVKASIITGSMALSGCSNLSLGLLVEGGSLKGCVDNDLTDGDSCTRIKRKQKPEPSESPSPYDNG